MNATVGCRWVLRKGGRLSDVGGCWKTCRRPPRPPTTEGVSKQRVCDMTVSKHLP